MELYPPDGFQCPYKRQCPHLDFLSTTWVLGEYRRGEDQYDEHLKIIDRFDERLKACDARIRLLERENAELRARLKLLHQRQFKPNKIKNEGARPPNMPPDASVDRLERKKRGAPTGHPGWSRPKPAHVDRNVIVPPPVTCPYCHHDKLKPSQVLREHIQEDIVLVPRTKVTRYLHGQSFCTRCNRLVAQADKNEMLNAPIGPVAKSVAIYLRYRIGISYRKTTELMRELFGLTFVPASAVGFDRKASACGVPIHEDLREKINVSDVVHADETSWRNDGVGHYAWFAGNEKLAFFHIDRHRSAVVAKTIFGEQFEGILVRDRYAAYNGLGRDWQSCLAHIITKAREIKREHGGLPHTEQEKATDRFCDQAIAFFKNACQTGTELNAGKIPWQSAKDIEKKFVNRLAIICEQTLAFKSAETLRAYLAGPEQKHLFTFLRHPGVPPTNNLAEQSLRHMVIFRKICFGTRSESGLRNHEILTSLVQTARRQNRVPRKFLQTLLTEDTRAAIAALYNNSS
jgi:transposase-like protein